MADAEERAPARWHQVFVYGTLKRGLSNYQRYLAPAEAAGKAAFVGEATTVRRYLLVLRPPDMAPHTGAPVLMDGDGRDGSPIEGEVFDVDDSTLEALDILEGVKAGMYYRSSISVWMRQSPSKQVTCLVYFFPCNERLSREPSFACYGEKEHASYQVQTSIADDSMLRLCKQPRRHGLRTDSPHAMEVHCLRLLPGADLLKELQRFVAERNLAAAAVLTCVGSTGQTRLRPAGRPEAREWPGPFEIVSLAGTLSSGGHHLHMSVSDEECHVLGGHVLEGCIVRTTAEIVLGEVAGVRFSRPHDPRTGYDELCVGERAAHPEP